MRQHPRQCLCQKLSEWGPARTSRVDALGDGPDVRVVITTPHLADGVGGTHPQPCPTVDACVRALAQTLLSWS